MSVVSEYQGLADFVAGFARRGEPIPHCPLRQTWR